MTKDAQPKGKWYPCGCREDLKSGEFVRVCAEHAESGTTPKDKKKKE